LFPQFPTVIVVYIYYATNIAFTLFTCIPHAGTTLVYSMLAFALSFRPTVQLFEKKKKAALHFIPVGCPYAPQSLCTCCYIPTFGSPYRIPKTGCCCVVLPTFGYSLGWHLFGFIYSRVCHLFCSYLLWLLLLFPFFVTKKAHHYILIALLFFDLLLRCALLLPRLLCSCTPHPLLLDSVSTFIYWFYFVLPHHTSSIITLLYIVTFCYVTYTPKLLRHTFYALFTLLRVRYHTCSWCITPVLRAVTVVTSHIVAFPFTTHCCCSLPVPYLLSSYLLFRSIWFLVPVVSPFIYSFICPFIPTLHVPLLPYCVFDL